MSNDIWITPDGYHIQDVLSMGRCICCGKLARVKTTHKGCSYWHCDAECSSQINAVIDELDGNGNELQAIRNN